MDKYLKDQHIQLFEKDDLKADIYVKNGTFSIKKYDNRIGHQLFLANNMDVSYLKSIFETRVFSKKRPDKDKLLEKLNLKEYDVYDIVKATHGVMVDDRFWFKFDEEKTCFDDVRIKYV